MRTATLIPDNERWLLDRGAAADLQAAMNCSVGHPTTDTEVEQTFRRLGDDEAWANDEVGSEQPDLSGIVTELQKAEGHAALDTLNKIRQLTWNQLYRDPGLEWEKVTSVRLPGEIATVYSMRISQSGRTTAHRDGKFMRLLRIATYHDAIYGKK